MRYKIVIADDERIICNMLTKLIHTDSLNLEIVGQAYSGESLLSLIQEKKPDIVLTDINMPAINGIEVIRRVQELGYKCSFIAISGYREFDYVYSALKYNVKDYLLKPITEEALNSTLEKVAQQLDAQKHQNQDSINSVWHYYMTTGLDEFGTGIATVEALNKTLSTRFSSGPFQGIIIKVDLISNTSEIFESQSFVNSKISDIIMHYLKPICHDLLLIDLQRELRCLINYSPENSTKIQHGLDDIFSQVQSIVATLSGIFTTFCVSAAHTEIGELSQIFHEAETAIMQRLILGTNQIIVYSPRPDPRPLVLQKLSLLKNRLDKAFDILDVEDFTRCINELFALPPDELLHDEFIWFIKNIPERFFQITTERIAMMENVPFARAEIANMLDMNYSLISYKCTLIEKIGELLTMIRAQVDQQNVKPVRQAIQYINTHYSQPIRMDDLAVQVGLNPVYFSGLFKKETGVSFTDYMISFRLSKAKDLLSNTNMTVSEIAWQCGFSDSRYFSRVFKKNVGIKPTEYRRIYG